MPIEIEKHAYDIFAQDTKDHVMTVLQDDGLRRHLRFVRPNSSMYWFELVTWPGRLAITGDVQSHIFSREQDMFTFFRQPAGWNNGSINPQYWAEKLITSRSDVQVYDEELVQEQVKEQIAEAESEFPGLTEKVEQELLDVWTGINWSSEDLTFEELSNFYFHVTKPGDCPGQEPQIVRTFTFEPGDWFRKRWSYQYLWACHAIQWGIAQYDKWKHESAASPDDAHSTA